MDPKIQAENLRRLPFFWGRLRPGFFAAGGSQATAFNLAFVMMCMHTPPVLIPEFIRI
jgi:hypothetical protein